MLQHMPEELRDALEREPGNARANWVDFVTNKVKPCIEEAFEKRRPDICGEWACAAYLVNPKPQGEAEHDFITNSRQGFLVSISNLPLLQVQLR